MVNRIACGFRLAERQQDHFGSPMATGARGAARGEREKERESKGGGERGEGKREGGGVKGGGGTCHNDKPGL